LEVMAEPRLLREFGEAALLANDFELAYGYLSLIHLLHPQSDEDRAAFPWAAAAFRGAYEKHRFRNRDSVWVTSEPIFVFTWLETFFAEGYPAKQVDSALRGAPHDLTVRFVEFAKSRRALAGWSFETEADNGRTTSISGSRATRTSN
jgi:hypothetical protein